ncbi:MAG TPA: hypothetical protein VFK80_03350 [Limnochordia bacterium]|nr:hypothetical protein [Limnochordia bacterium]
MRRAAGSIRRLSRALLFMALCAGALAGLNAPASADAADVEQRMEETEQQIDYLEELVEKSESADQRALWEHQIDQLWQDLERLRQERDRAGCRRESGRLADDIEQFARELEFRDKNAHQMAKEALPALKKITGKPIGPKKFAKVPAVAWKLWKAIEPFKDAADRREAFERKQTEGCDPRTLTGEIVYSETLNSHERDEMTDGYVSRDEAGRLTATYEIAGSAAETGYAWQLRGQATVADQSDRSTTEHKQYRQFTALGDKLCTSDMTTREARSAQGSGAFAGRATLSDDGTYVISVDPPEIAGSLRSVLSLQDTCDEGFQQERVSDESFAGGGARVEGAVDPDDPAHLAGHSHYRDPYTGAEIDVTWDLVFR